ncbi:hypothetical protein Dimus_023023 [Dionaea muscipula]
MALKRRLDYDDPAIPRAPRSIRGTGLRSKTSIDGQVCAFELLATVAGKLLLESESSSASSSASPGLDHSGIGKDTIKQEVQNVHKPFGKHDEQGSSEESVFISRLSLKNCNQKETSNLAPETVSEAVVEHGSAIASSACSGKTDYDVESAVLNAEDPLELPRIQEGGSLNCGESYDVNLGSSVDRLHEGIRAVETGAKAADGLCGKSPELKGIVELSLRRNSAPGASLLSLKNGVKIASTDDDGIFSRSSHPNARVKAMLSPARYGDQRLRELPTSKHWKVTPKIKDSEVVDTGSKMKQVHRTRKSCYEHERSQHDTPFKKRKSFDQSSVVTYEGGRSSESVFNRPEKDVGITKSGWAAKLHTGNAVSSPMMGHQKSPILSNSNVKFTIKSFKVPELFIEVPEITTVGSLKRTILEAVTSILGGGLRVGVLLHGKKVQDDNRTLQQAGISRNDNLDTLGFLIEPRTPAQPSPPIFSESPVPVACDSPKPCLNRPQFTPNEDISLPNTPGKSSTADSGSCADTSHDLAPSPTADMGNKTESYSKSPMPVLEATIEPLAMVPLNLRPKRSEIGQRRTRRPFSVSEVEALVEAVEKLGTGRWRDVKLCAFENAKHRTYVDLKDKWKTLVHTARISPQQRRGEPVPQGLLDRVLAAHAYWTQNQAKQHGKQQQQQPGMLKITEVPA